MIEKIDNWYFGLSDRLRLVVATVIAIPVFALVVGLAFFKLKILILILTA